MIRNGHRLKKRYFGLTAHGLIPEQNRTSLTWTGTVQQVQDVAEWVGEKSHKRGIPFPLSPFLQPGKREMDCPGRGFPPPFLLATTSHGFKKGKEDQTEKTTHKGQTNRLKFGKCSGHASSLNITSWALNQPKFVPNFDSWASLCPSLVSILFLTNRFLLSYSSSSYLCLKAICETTIL